MQSEPNTRIVGAFIIGFALVGGAYVVNNFGEQRVAPVPQSATIQSAVTQRQPIEVLDADNNGIEDWRDEFITAAPIVLDEGITSEYVEPTTLTGQLGINFTETILRARTLGPIGRNDAEIISDTIDILQIETSHRLYDTPDVTIMQTWTEEDIYNYANSIGLAITTNSQADLDYELFILQDILNRGDESRLSELEALAEVYANTRDDTLAVPVPRIFVKQHLDLVNTYAAIYHDINAMILSFEDPVVAFMRLRRYEDDALGLNFALQNMYLSLEPYAELFSVDDPAVVFVQFNPNIVNNQL